MSLKPHISARMVTFCGHERKGGYILSYDEYDALEVWRPIKNFPCYDVSDYGRVRKRSPYKILKQTAVSKNNSVIVTLYRDGKYYRPYVSHLVAEAFIKNPNHFRWVRHKDGDNSNNNMTYLTWSPISPKSKCVMQYTRDMEFVKEWNSINEAARTLGLNPSNICVCTKIPTRTTGGYKWRVADE